MSLLKHSMLLCLVFAASANSADWPRFRGPNGTGVGDATGLPTEFGPGRNMAWKAAIPFGRSSPIVAGGRIFLTAADGDNLITLSYDAATGRQLWRKDLKRTHAHKTYHANDPASPTPAADDKSIYVFFADFGLISYSFEGKERWRHPLGSFDNFYGMASSPVVSGGLVVLLCDQNGGSFLLALDKDNGRQRWKTQRPQATEGWAVPIVHQDQLLAVGANRVDSYFLSTGEPRWWIPIASHGSMGTPVVHGDSLLLTTMGSDTPLLHPSKPRLARTRQGQRRQNLLSKNSRATRTGSSTSAGSTPTTTSSSIPPNGPPCAPSASATSAPCRFP